MQGEIPKRIDRYEILEAIGFGAMGAVYKAFDPIIKRPVAVKTLRLDVPPGSQDHRDFLERFSTEAKTAGRLSHPNIVTLYDVGHIQDQIPWLAMEYVEGRTVASILESQRLKPELVIGLVSQIASALDYAHREGVVHRDIKPSNVIVHGGEKVKVTDFGIASFVNAERNHTGFTMGTPSYMSPEQAMGEDLDGKTDIFSLGVVAFEMLSGQQPFPGNNVTSILYKLVHSDPIHPDGLEVLGLLPHKWHEVFARVLAKDPDDRYPNASEFVSDLELCLGSWFGALEGETVIVSDRSAFPKDSDATYVDSPAAFHEDRSIRAASSDVTATTMAGREYGDPFGGASRSAAPPASSEETRYDGPPPGEIPERNDHSPTSRRGLDSAAGVGRRASWKRLVGLAAAGAFLIWLVTLLTRPDGRTGAVGSDVIDSAAEILADSGTLRVFTDPEGALVLVDGVERGETPLEIQELPLGEYDVEVRLDGYLPAQVTAQMTQRAPGATFDLALESKPKPRPAPALAFVRIDSQPQGAAVEIDGASKGRTPLERVRVPAGERVVRLHLEGYLPWEDSIVARAGGVEEIDAVLTSRGGPPRAARVEEPEVSPQPRAREADVVEKGAPGVTAAKCLECPAVAYPSAAREARLEGAVLLGFVIDESGQVRDLEIHESGGAVFDDAVIDTVRGWRYQPAIRDGVPVKMRWMQRFRFRQGR
ncbi:MAG TPA: TonB family protein [Vicinamibacteria bacterium]|nr:TonB family protein [Vicinamibacteria bacterium]